MVNQIILIVTDVIKDVNVSTLSVSVLSAFNIHLSKHRLILLSDWDDRFVS